MGLYWTVIYLQIGNCTVLISLCTICRDAFNGWILINSLFIHSFLSKWSVLVNVSRFSFHLPLKCSYNIFQQILKKGLLVVVRAQMPCM